MTTKEDLFNARREECWMGLNRARTTLDLYSESPALTDDEKRELFTMHDRLQAIIKQVQSRITK